MARGTYVTKAYENFNGLDLRSSDLVRSPDFASAATNGRRVGTNTLTSRNGYQTLTNSRDFMGLYTYRKYDSTLGHTIEEVIGVAENLYRLREYTIVVTYTAPMGGGLFGGGYWGGMFSGGIFT